MNLCGLCGAMLLLAALASFTAPISVTLFSDGATNFASDETGNDFRTFFRADSAPSVKFAAFSSSPVANFLFRASFLFASAPPPRKHKTGWNAAISSKSSLMFAIVTISPWLPCPTKGGNFLECIKAGQQKIFVMMLPPQSSSIDKDSDCCAYISIGANSIG